MSQCVVVYCSVLQCVAVCCSALQCIAVCCIVLQYVAVRCSVLHCVAICNLPKMREIPLWSSTNGAIAYFLILPGSLLSITNITAYICFSPLKPSGELNHKSGLHIVPLALILELIFVPVKHNNYILLYACSTTVRFLHSWADGVLHEHMAISCVTLAYCNMVCYISVLHYAVCCAVLH